MLFSLKKKTACEALALSHIVSTVTNDHLSITSFIYTHMHSLNKNSAPHTQPVAHPCLIHTH